MLDFNIYTISGSVNLHAGKIFHEILADIVCEILASLVHLCIYLFLFGFQAIPLEEIMNKKARTEIINTLTQMNASKVTITINGIKTKQKSVILEALQQLQSMENKGSLPPIVQCEISDGEKKLVLILSRDNISQDHLYDYSYIVYYPKYHMTKSNPIGGFYSKSIDLENP